MLTGYEIEGAGFSGGKVQWAVVSGDHSTRDGAGLEEIGRCLFSNDEVGSLVAGNPYAGLAPDRET